jgi:hypothetical protein
LVWIVSWFSFQLLLNRIPSFDQIVEVVEA